MNEGQQQQPPAPGDFRIPIILTVNQVNEVLMMLGERQLKDVILLFTAIKSQADSAVQAATQRIANAQKEANGHDQPAGQQADQPDADGGGGERVAAGSRH